MQNGRLSSLLFAFIEGALVLAFLGYGRSDVGAQWKVYRDSRFHYTLQCPAMWRLDATPTGGVSVYSFPQEKSVRGVVLPLGGAEINFLARRASEQQVDQWIQEELGDDRPESRNLLKVPSPSSDGPWEFIEVSWKWEVGPKTFRREVADYFELKNMVFRARLSYWDGDPRANFYRSTLHHMITTLAVRKTR